MYCERGDNGRVKVKARGCTRTRTQCTHTRSRVHSVANESPSFDHIFFAVNASLRVIKTGPRGMVRGRSRT